MLAFTAALVASALAAPALAHFTLDYPPTRGFDEDKEPDVNFIPSAPFMVYPLTPLLSALCSLSQKFCGGYPLGERSPYPLTNGSWSIGSHHTAATGLFVLSSLSPFLC